MSLNCQKMIRIRFEAKGIDDWDFWTTSDPFLVLSRPARTGSDWVQVSIALTMRASVNRREGYLFSHMYVQIRRTETIMNNLNPKWSILYISMEELCDSNPEMPLLVICIYKDEYMWTYYFRYL